METPLSDEIDDVARARRFRAALDHMQGPLFAVLDGGYFDDLEDELADADISGRSLFLKGGDENMRRDGPWLVPLNNRRAREQIEELALDKPCAVFWLCPEGEQALWRHLRTINEIRIPDERFLANAESSDLAIKYERVLFRHWDPSVLSTVIPLLTTEQLVRVFGPATAVLINTPGGPKRALRPKDSPKTLRGMLVLGADQLSALHADRRTAYCDRMSSILKTMAPEQTAGMTQEGLDERILQYEASGNQLGLTQERSLSIWGFLMLSSGDRFENQPEIRRFIQSGPGTPDENVEMLLHQMSRLVDSMEEVG